MLQNINFLIIQYYKIKQAVNEKKSKKFRSPLIFYNICEFLDDDSLFELKFVCVSSRKFIQNDEKLENITLKLELKKLRKLNVTFLFKSISSPEIDFDLLLILFFNKIFCFDSIYANPDCDDIVETI